MGTKSVIPALKGFQLTDDQILEIVLEDTVIKSAEKLRVLMHDKWNMTVDDALLVVHKLRDELL